MRLCIFDFDGTLFRSGPPAPPGEHPVEWFSKPASLDPPFKSRVPDQTAWIRPTCEWLRSLMKGRPNFLVLMTGREVWFEDRIKELLEQQGLWFDQICCRVPGYDTAEFKLHCLDHYLWTLPDLEEVYLWDDRPELLGQYVRFCKAQGIPTKAFLVVAEPYSLES